MNIEQIREVFELMKESDLSELELEDKDFKLRLSRQSGAAPLPAPAPVQTAPAIAPTPSAAGTESSEHESDVVYIKSPMVGTFYRASSPESEPYVEVGSTVKEDSVTCIIEAMKVLNEIQADVKGKIVEILVENGESVEYGQSLFKVKP